MKYFLSRIPLLCRNWSSDGHRVCWNHACIAPLTDLFWSFPGRSPQDPIPVCYSMASLLIELWLCGILPREKRQCGRWSSGGWRQVQQCSGCRLLPVQVSQYLIYGVLVFNACNHPDGTSAPPTGLNVNIENSLQYLVYLSNSFPSERLLLSQVVVCGDGRELEYGGLSGFENCVIYQDRPMAPDYYRSFTSVENVGK